MPKPKITWSILDLHHNPKNGGVYHVQWECAVEQGKHTYSKTATESFEPNPKGDWWVAFDKLTESIVLSWVIDRQRRSDETPLAARTRIEDKCVHILNRIIADEKLAKGTIPWVKITKEEITDE